MSRRKTVAVLAVLMTLGLGGVACAGGFTGFYDFSGTQYTDDFTDVRRGAQINDDGALDLGGTENTALNFTGMVGTKGDTWLTKWTPGGSPSVFDGTCLILSAADVLIHPHNNRKGAGVVTLLNDTNPGDKGLALILYDNGNTDSLQLATIDPATGKLTTLDSTPLAKSIKEDEWYEVFVEVLASPFPDDVLSVHAFVSSHEDPKDPNSATDGLLGVFEFFGSLSGTGLQAQGQVGIVASAINAVVDSSVTNWAAEDFCFE